MVAINEILLPGCTGEGCGGDSDICMASRVHHRNAENRAPVTRNHRSAPILGRWMEQDPAQYINGANTYQFVDSSPVGNVDAEGLQSYAQDQVQGQAEVAAANSETAYENQFASPEPSHYRPQGTFTVKMFLPGPNSVGVVVQYNLPPSLAMKSCKCTKIAIVQYVKDVSSWGNGGISLHGVGFTLDGGFPYGKGDRKMSQPWVFGSGGTTATLDDNPSAAVWGNGIVGVTLLNAFTTQRLFEARHVAVCLSGADKGVYYGAVEWGFYENWSGDTLATLHAGGRSASGPIIPGRGHWPSQTQTPFLYVRDIPPKP